MVVIAGLVVSSQWTPFPSVTTVTPDLTPEISTPPVVPPQPTDNPLSPPAPVPSITAPSTVPLPAATPIPPAVAPPPVAVPPAVIPPTVKEVKHGHLAYQEDDPTRLVVVGRYVRGDYERAEQLDIEAAEAFQQMEAAALAAGHQLMPISGFRTIVDQQKLFDRQIQRQGSVEAAARLSAPPGFSEHHTGYAIDIADRTRPDTDLKYEFEYTKAYAWLWDHADAYGFELSFPPDNGQGVNFEPWHWRYVVSPRAQAIFDIASGF